MGPNEVVRDIAPLIADFRMHFVKTHDLPNRDNNPAVVLIRDGRDAVVSYAHFFLKTERGIDHPGRDLFEETLRGIVDGDSFGGWSDNVNAWVDRVGPDRAVRYEDLGQGPGTYRYCSALPSRSQLQNEWHGASFVRRVARPYSLALQARPAGIMAQ